MDSHKDALQQASTLNNEVSFDFTKHEFKVPVKRIDDPVTLEMFKNSNACKELLGFIGGLAQAATKSRMTETPLADVNKYI